MISPQEIKAYFDSNGYPDYDIDLGDLIIKGDKSKEIVIWIVRELQQHSGNRGWIFFYKYLKKYYWIVRRNKK